MIQPGVQNVEVLQQVALCEKDSGIYTMDCQIQTPHSFLPLLFPNRGQAGSCRAADLCGSDERVKVKDKMRIFLFV